MQITVSQNLTILAKACPFPLYAVGGYVRDSLAGLKSENADMDICAPAPAELFCRLAQNCGATAEAVYKNTGTVKLSFGDEKYEFTSFRSDEYVRGVHSPAKIFFTDDIILDAKRRDFKCNAVYYDIKAQKLCDPLGGIEDIKNKAISTVAEADKVFGEDGLRLMRLARQAAQLDFTPTNECLAGAKKNCSLIADISAERIYCEIDAILHADKKYGVAGAHYRGLKILDAIGVLDILLPELTLGRGMPQNSQYHKYDVLEHTLRTVLYADDAIRFSALLHDAGKPKAYSESGKYYKHEYIGLDVVREICVRLKVPKKLALEAEKLCELHMYDLSGDTKEGKVRRFIVKNIDIYDKLMLIKQADYSGCCDDLSVAPCVKKWSKIYTDMIEKKAPLRIKDLAIGGDDLKALGIEDKLIGETLQRLLFECVGDSALNTKKTLIKMAKRTAQRANSFDKRK